MIHKLPREITLKISSYLTFHSKLSLAKTCSKLYNLISSASLYEQLNLHDGIRDPEKIIKKFERNEFDGSQVKELTIHKRDIPEALRSQLSIIFPNVSCIHSGGSDENILREWSQTEDQTPSRWINTIQAYDLYLDWPEILYTLKYNTFPHLTELRLGHLYSIYERREGFDPLYFIPIIKNAPSLTKLVLHDCDINLVFLEEVHTSCPHLRTLKLDFVMMVIDTPSLPENIKPADGVLNLEICDTANFDRNGLLFEYIIKKYTGLLSFEFNLNGKNYRVKDKLELYFRDFFHDLDSDNEDEEPETIISRLKEDYYLGNLVFESSGSNFFSRLPKAIKTLKMDVRSINGLIEILSDANMNLTEIDFCDGYYDQSVLKNANQFRHFEKMTSLKTLKIPISVATQKYQNAVISSSITNLELRCPNGPVYIHWVLEMFSCLENLSIVDSTCDVGRFADDANIHPLIHPTLKSLRLSTCVIKPRVVNYMKALAIILESKGRAIDIDLSGCTLEEFSMKLSSRGVERPFTIQKATEKVIHASWGESIVLEQSSSNLGILEYKADIKGLYDANNL